MVSRTRRLTLFLIVADLALTLTSLYLADFLRHTLAFGRGDADNLAWISWRHYLVVAAIWAFMLQFFRTYEPRRIFTIVDELRALIPAATFALFVVFGYVFIAKVEYLSRLLFAYFYVLNLLLLINLRWVVKFALKSSLEIGFGRRLLIVGAGPVGRRVAALLGTRP